LTKSVAVFDYGSGNVHSACRALEAAGADVVLTADRKALLEAAGMVLPGVGAFAAVMQKLHAQSAAGILDQRLTAQRPVLGICVGMQVMFDAGLEHGIETEGFGQWPGKVEKLVAQTLPHMGWSKVESEPDSKLFQGLAGERFYFVHTYAAKSWDLDIQPPFKPAQLAWSEHGERFLAAVENGPLSATQFHPEKSGEAGLKLLKNWITSL
jgi:imidazole glycerol-phosphate synthase subunit HisH